MSTVSRPPSTAWGSLIRIAREAAGLSITRASREVTRRGGKVGPGQWGNIERGYEATARGETAPMNGSERAVAWMALVTGVTPEELEQCGRPEAAELLEHLLAGQSAPPAYSDPSERRIDADPDLTETQKHALIVLLRALRQDAGPGGQSGEPPPGGYPPRAPAVD